MAYRFLKFHRKYTKRKATLPAAVYLYFFTNTHIRRRAHFTTFDVACRLHSSPIIQPTTEDDFVSVLFPSQQLDPKFIQEQWEKFQQSRLYLPENKPSPGPPRRRGLPPPPAQPPPASTQNPAPPGQLTAQERWERFQRSPIFSVNNQGEAQPQIGRARRNTAKERTTRPSQPPTPSSSRSSSPTPSPSPSPAPSPSQGPPDTFAPIAPPILDPAQDMQPLNGSQRMRPPLLERNPSFRYGAYVHEPTHFRAHPDDTAEEYIRLAQAHRSESLPNMLDPAALAPRAEVPTLYPAPPVALESFGANLSDEDTQSESTRAIDSAMRKERRMSVPPSASINFAHPNAANETQRNEPAHFESFANRFKQDTYVDSPRVTEFVYPQLKPKMGVPE